MSQKASKDYPTYKIYFYVDIQASLNVPFTLPTRSISSKIPLRLDKKG
jgi:hypothetical protein